MTRNKPEYVCQTGSVEPYIIAHVTYIDQICLISHVEVMDYRGFIQMSELCHIVCLVELGRVNFIDSLGINLSLLKIGERP